VTSIQAIVEVSSNSLDCPASQFEVRTGYRQETISGSNITGVQNVARAEGFVFMVA
jgi:hypothetical protein